MTPSMDVDRLLAAARETMARVKDCWLATPAESGGVSVRVVSPIPGVSGEEDWTIWFATKRSSRKAAEIRRAGRLTLGYQYHPDRAYVSLLGPAVLIEDRSAIRDRWSEGFRPYFPGGPENPDTIFVRVNVDRIELCVSGFTPEPFGSRHSVIERDGDRLWKIVSN
jgi:general stress protein 26